MKAIDRLYEYLAKKGVRPTSVESEIGLSNGYLSVQKKRGSDIGEGVMNKIIDYFQDISPEWLLTGQGEMLRSATPSYVVHDSAATPHSLPFFDVEFSGGFEEAFNDQTTIPDGYICAPGFDKAECWCRLRGNSMHPEIKNGDLIALRTCDISSIIYGHIYAIVMGDYRTVKRVRKSKRDNYLRLIPINTEEYDEQEFHKKDIIRIFEVVGNLRKQS